MAQIEKEHTFYMNLLEVGKYHQYEITQNQSGLDNAQSSYVYMFAVQKYEALNQLPVGLSQQILPKIIKEFQVLNGKFFFAKSADLNFETRSKIEEISYHMLNFALNFGYPRAKRDDMFGNFCEKILLTQELINKCRKLEYLQLLNGKLLDGVSPSSLYILGTIYSLVKPSSATPTDLKTPD